VFFPPSFLPSFLLSFLPSYLNNIYNSVLYTTVVRMKGSARWKRTHKVIEGRKDGYRRKEGGGWGLEEGRRGGLEGRQEGRFRDRDLEGRKEGYKRKEGRKEGRL
jgi:hypothetical protein